MRLNKKKPEKENNEKKEEDEKEEEEKDEDKGKEKKNQKKKGENDEEEEEENDENDYVDNHKSKMIRNSKYEKVKGKKLIKIPHFEPVPFVDKNQILLRILITIVLIFISLLIIVNVVAAIVTSRKKKNIFVNFENDEIRVLNAMDNIRYMKLRDDLLIAYCTVGILNLNKFYEDNINLKAYTSPDPSLTNIHISIGFSDACIDEIIKHLSSVIEHMSSSTFLHVHMMGADNFTVGTFSKIMNMVHKLNNNTEIIVYNANKVKEDFKIREDKGISINIEYARLYAFTAIKDVHKLIMLSLDNIMIEKDLTDLYNINMDGIYGRGVSEVPSIHHSVDWMDQYILDRSHFINGAVILINLELCQKDNFYNKAKELNNNDFYLKTEDPAQDILNVLMKKKIEFLNPKFNKMNFYEKDSDKNDESKWYPWVGEAMKYGETNNHFYTKEDLLNADNDPVIVNYLWDCQLNKKIQKYEEEKNKYAKINEIK